MKKDISKKELRVNIRNRQKKEQRLWEAGGRETGKYNNTKKGREN